MIERLNFEARYPHPPAEVWRALTDPKALAKWLMPNDFQPELGHKFEFRGAGGAQPIACEVTELQEPHRLAFKWEGGEDEPPAIVSWTLQPDGDGGTHLTLEHNVLVDTEPYVLIQAAMNWRRALHAMPVPIVYMEDRDEPETDRLAGFRDRSAEVAQREEGQAVCK